MSVLLQVRDLHEIPCNQCFTDVGIVRATVEVLAAHLEAQSGHDANKLLPNIVGVLKCSGIDEIVSTPLGIFICIVNKRMIRQRKDAGQMPT
jgi:hypothetical protein